ncbi:hypothetical protein KH5_22550 [Urechidicola sp. KH5]
MYAQDDYLEDFEAYTPEDRDDLPVGWTFVINDINDPGFQVVSDIEIFYGLKALYHGGITLSTAASTSWAISPAFTVTASSDLTFDYLFGFLFDVVDGIESFDVMISAGSNDPDDGDFVLLYDLLSTVTYDDDEYEWRNLSIDLSAYAGQTIYIGLANNADNESHVVYLDNFFVSNTTNVVLDTAENELSYTVELFPTVTNHLVHINTTENIETIEVFNTLGRKVLVNRSNTNQTQLDFTSLSSGVYIVKFAIGGKSETYKIIKK